nr:parasitoid killing factor [Mamestra configurata]
MNHCGPPMRVAVLLFICVIGATAQYVEVPVRKVDTHDTNKQSTRYLYTRPSKSTSSDRSCIGDCVHNRCVVDANGKLENCINVNSTPPKRWYTARYRQSKYIKCKSACISVNRETPWCYVNANGDTDYCNKDVKSQQQTYEFEINLNSTVRQPCITPCAYIASTKYCTCRTNRGQNLLCAPFAHFTTPALPPPSTSDDALSKCVRQPNLWSVCRTPRRSHRQVDNTTPDPLHLDACLAASNPDNIDVYRRPDRRGIFRSVSAGTVLTDAGAFTDIGETYVNVQAPLVSYTTIYNSYLNLNLPVVVRARIDTAALASVVTPRPSNVIQNTVPSLTAALQTIKYRYNNVWYDVGHMVGYFSGGQDVDYNYSPQTETLNRGLWLSMENHIRAWVHNTSPYGFVDMLIVVYYDSDIDFLPYAFGVNLAYYYTEGSVASICNDMMYFNQDGHRRTSRDVSAAVTNSTTFE